MNHNHNHNHMNMDMNMNDNSNTKMPMPIQTSTSMNASSMSAMIMSLHFGISETIVFPEWVTNDNKSFIGSCFGLILIGIIYELLKYFRSNLKRFKPSNYKFKRQTGSYNISEKESNSSIQDSIEAVKIIPNRKSNYFSKLLSLEHIVQTVLHLVQYTISFFLMLAFMTYNYWICISILIGITLGYFIFGVDRSLNQDLDDCCD